MKKIIFILLVMLSCSKTEDKLENTHLLRSNLKEYLDMCKFYKVDPTFDYAPNYKYIDILGYKGNVDSIYTVRKNKEEIKIINKAIELYELNVDRCVPEKWGYSFRYRITKTNMLTNINEFRYISFLDKSVLENSEFNKYHDIIDIKDSLYYFKSK